MNWEKEKPLQFELFPGVSASSVFDGRFRFSLANWTLTLEHGIIGLVFLIMVMVILFSLGVERGRHVAPVEIKETAVLTQAQKGSATLAAGPASLKRAQTVASAVLAKTIAGPAVAKSSQVAKDAAAPLASTDSKKLVDKGYTIQVASYKQESYAQKEVGVLQKKGYEAFVLAKGSFSIVCVGQFAQKDEAQKISKKLKSVYKDNLIRSL